MRDVRSRMREITVALGAQAKSATVSANDVAVVAREIAALRVANTEQADMVEGLLKGHAPNGEPTT
jgi:hypothetical protein